MTLSTTGYTVGSNQPLTHARILYAPITGTATGGGTNATLATNDYTFQRWLPAAGADAWTLATSGGVNVDCCFIAAHSLAGKTITIQTNAVASPNATFTTRATVAIPAGDNSTICVLFSDGSGFPLTIRQVRVGISEGDGMSVGIIRFGVALQLTQAFYAGHTPTSINRVTQAKQQFSETGQWLGRQLMRQAVTGSYSWEHLRIDWYRTYFEPFAKTLPLYPFGIIGNPARFSDDVAWCWTDSDVAPETMGVNDYVSVSLAVTGVF